MLLRQEGGGGSSTSWNPTATQFAFIPSTNGGNVIDVLPVPPRSGAGEAGHESGHELPPTAFAVAAGLPMRGLPVEVSLHPLPAGTHGLAWTGASDMPQPMLTPEPLSPSWRCSVGLTATQRFVLTAHWGSSTSCSSTSCSSTSPSLHPTGSTRGTAPRANLRPNPATV